MSTSIEQRVVQMRFDNKQFESGVAQSMSTLDKLKAALNFKGAADSFDEISRAADNVSLTPIMDQTDKVGGKFDAMAVVAITALSRITNAAISAGTGLVKSLSIEQVSSGFSKYEQRTAAVQTLVNATGRSVEDIEGYMSKLMRYSDETSYGFGDMATSLGTMVSAGGDIEKLVPLLEGFGNAVSFVGKGAAEYQLAIRQLSQGYGRNALMQEDWRPIESQLGGAKQLKEVFIEVGEELGKIKKGQVSLGEFNDSLRKKWLDQSVMEEALGRFAEMTERAFEMVDAGEADSFAEAYEILSKSVDDYRIRAAKAAQEAKSFTEAVDATKDAVSSGWMETFQIIFGNYEEATRLWTDLTEVLWQVFASSAGARNEMLQNWKYMGGRDKLIETFANAWENLSRVMETVKEAFRDIFPPMTATRLVNLTHALNKFIESLRLSDEALHTLKVAIKVLLLPVQVAVQVVRVGVAAITTFIKVIFKLGDALLSLPSKIDKVNNPLRKLFGDDRYEQIVSSLTAIVQKLGNAFGAVSDRIATVTKSAGSFLSSKLMSSISRLAELLTPIAEWILDRIVDGFEILANFDYSKISDWAIKAIDSLVVGFGLITKGCTTAISAIKDFFASFKDMTAIEIITKIIDGVASLKTNMMTFIKSLGFTQIMTSIKTEAKGITDVISSLGEAVGNLLKRLTPAKILVFSFGTSIVWMFMAISRTVESVGKVADNASTVLGGVTGTLKAFQQRLKPSKILQITLAIGVLAVSLGALSQIDSDKLLSSTIALGSLMVVLGVLVAGVAAVNKFLVSSEAMAANLLKVSKSMIMMAASVAILAGALLLMSKVDMEGMWSKLGMLAVIMGVLGAASIAVAALAPELSKGAQFLLLFALSIGIIVSSLEKLGNADLKAVEANVGTLITVMGLLAGLSVASAHVKFGSAAGLTLFILDILLFVKVLQKINNVDVASLSTGIAMFTAMLASLIPMAFVAKRAGKEMAGAAAMIASMSISMIVLSYAIKMIGELDPGVMVRGTVVVAGILLLFSGILQVAKTAEKGAKIAAPSFLAMSAAILVLGVAINYIGGLELKNVIQGGVVVAALLGLFTILTKVAGGASKATGSIAAMSVALGLITASLMLLTLIPFEEVMQAAGALSLVLIAFGAALRLISDFKISTAIGSIALLLTVVLSLQHIVNVLKNIDTTDAIKIAGSVGLMLVALGISVALLQKTMGDAKLSSLAQTFTLMIGMLGMVSAIFGLLSVIPYGEGLVEKAGSVSMILLALAGAMKIVRVTTAKPENVTKTLGMILGMLAMSTAAFAILTYLPLGEGMIEKATSLSIILLALSGATSILAAMAPGLIAVGKSWAAALKGIGVISLGLVALAALVMIAGGIFSQIEGLEPILDAAEYGLTRIGTILGEFVGSIIGGIGSGITSTFPVIAQNLSDFAENVKPFLELKVDSAIVSSIGSLVEVIAMLSGASFVDGITTILTCGNGGIGAFGAKLEEFAPHLRKFCDEVADIKVGSVNAAARLMEGIGEMLEALPTEGGVMTWITGSKNLKSFGEGLQEFAPGFVGYCEAISDSTAISSAVGTTKNVASCIKTLSDSVPESGGVLQSFFGEKDMSKFGGQLADFATGLQDFFKIITGQAPDTVPVDMDVVKNCANVGKVLGEFAQTIPSAGGALQDFFGTKDVGVFGEQLRIFATGLMGFFTKMDEDKISDTAVEQAIKIGGAFRDFAATLPTDNGFLQLFTGSKDLGVFGDDVRKYGEALAAFFTSFSEVSLTDADIELVKKAGLGFTEILKDIPDYTQMNKLLGSTDLTFLSNSMQNFGVGMLMYSNNVKQMDFDAVSRSISIIEDLIGLSDLIAQMDENMGRIFSGYLSDLASTSVESIVASFSESEIRLSDAITEMVGAAFESASVNLSANSGSYTVLVDALIAGVDAHENDIVVKARAICTLFIDSIKDEWASFEEAGSFIIISLIVGIDSQIQNVETKIDNLMDSVIYSAEQSLGITGTYSTKFQNLGKYSIEGYIKGLDDEQSRIFAKLRTLGNDILTTFQSSLGVNSPSVKFAEVGMYSILGFNKGIDDNVASAKKTMVKMGASLLQSIKDFFGIHSPSTVTRDEVGRYIVEGIAEGITKNMSAEEAASKKAQNIINAFKSEFDKFDLDKETGDLELKLWSMLNPLAIRVSSSKVRFPSH